MPTSPRLFALALALGLAACNTGPAPQTVTPELPEAITSTDPLLVNVKVRDASGRSDIAKPPLEMTLEPADVGAVAKDGTVRCAKNGDAKLTVDIRGTKGSAALRCRLVDRIELSPPSRIDITKGTFVLAARALAKDGKELADVPFTITPSKGTPLKVKGLEITPVAVGETDLVVRAGSAQTKFPVKVVRSIQPEALPMNDGKRINLSLNEGRYELTVHLASPKPLKVEWRGAPYCDYKGGALKDHVSTCVLQGKGGVVTDNPKFVDSGETTVSHDGIELFEVP
jgi:hypothetical protein